MQSPPQSKSQTGSEEGELYEMLCLAILSKRGYDLSKEKIFCEFSVGREVKIGLERKFDDVIFKYKDQDSDKNLIFLQLKHKQGYYEMDSEILFTEASIAKDILNDNYMRQDFNLQQYFISYLSVREHLKTTTYKELREGVMKYVVIFTNAGLNTKELKRKTCTFEKAPDNIIDLFNLKDSSSQTRQSDHCKQFIKISKRFFKILKRSSDKHRLATELAHFVEGNKIMRIDVAILKCYHVALATDILKISKEKKDKNLRFCVAKFQDSFFKEVIIEKSQKELRKALFETIRELDESKREMNDDELTKILKNMNWRVVPNFGQNDAYNEIHLPNKWKTINDKDIKELATELAKFVVSKKIMGIEAALLQRYHVSLATDILKISEEKGNKNSKYREAEFQDSFVRNAITGSKKELREAIFKAIKKLDETKRDKSDDELTETLMNSKWRVDTKFGKPKPREEIPKRLPSQWAAIKLDTVKEFLELLVFIVNQPKVKDLETCLSISAQQTLVKDVSLSHVLDKIVNVGAGFYEYIKNTLGVDKSTKNKEIWIYDSEIVNFFEEQIQFIISFLATNMTLLYDSEVMQYGKFNNYRNLDKSLKSFLESNRKILCVNTSVTLFSAIKVIRYLNNETGRISVCLDSLQYQEDNYVFNSFKTDSNNLLTIECRHAVNESKKEKFYKKLSEICKDEKNKKIILIIQQDMYDYLAKKFRNDFQSEGLLLFEEDSMNITDFDPIEDPVTKNVLVFQEQKEKLSLKNFTDINNWASYKDYISQGGFQSNQDIIDFTTLVKVFNNEEIELGSEPLGTCDLKGAYASLIEEINVETFAAKLSRDSDNIYIISGINESDETEKIDRLNQYLGLGSESNVIENQIRDINGDGKILIAEDEFKEENFRKICHDFPCKRVFWICLKHTEESSKLYLQMFYNPDFYLKRKFNINIKEIIFRKDVKKELTRNDLSDTFIFHSIKDQREILEFFELTNEDEKEQFENNRNSKIKFCSSLSEAEAEFKRNCGKNTIVHWLKIEEEKITWCNSHGSLDSLRSYKEVFLVEEKNLVKEIKDRKVAIIAGDPGMGKTTTLTKLYESKYENVKLIETHWVINVNLIDHLQAIKDIGEHKDKLDVFDVINFLSRVDSKLNHNLAKSLLKLAILDKNFKKPILLIFDEFDQVVHEEDRKKIISLLRFLKNETAVKFWIATRLHCRDILENELLTFAIEFVPMNDKDKLEYVKKYIRDRTFLTLSETRLSEVFVRDNGVDYIEQCLKEMTSVFESDKFFGIPLQLHLMLEVRIKDVINGIKNDTESPTDIWEVHKQIIDRKYDIYFKKVGPLLKIPGKFIYEQHHRDLANCKIEMVNPNYSLEESKGYILSVGIVISQGNGMNFIHSTFEEFYKAKIFKDWIKEEPGCFSNLSKQNHLFSEILLKPDCKRIHAFLNVELRNVEQCGGLMKKLLGEKPFNEGEKLLDAAGRNAHIVRLLIV